MTEANDWQDISTAPTGGSGWRGLSGPRILLSDGSQVSAGHWDGDSWRNEAEAVSDGHGWCGHETWNPTHWQPLPQPPEH